MTAMTRATPTAASVPPDPAVERSLNTVIDPCMEAAGLGLSIVDLGLVREIRVTESEIAVELGLTEPGCGFTHALVTRIDDALALIAGGRCVNVTFNWSDPWTEARLSDHGRSVIDGARSRGRDVIASSRINA